MKLVNANILTMENIEIKNGYIIIENGKITDVGNMDKFVDDGSEVIDISGQTVLPGFIDAHCHLGLWEEGLAFEGDDGNEDTEPITPHLRALDAINPFDRSFDEAVSAGITTVVTGPGSANPIAGQICAMKTCGNFVDDMLIKSPLAIKFAFGENPKNSHNAKDQSPVTRMATAALIREMLYKAKRYIENREDEEGDVPEYDAKCDALVPLLNREIKAHMHAHRADDICTAIRIAEEFNLDYVIVHCTEGYLISNILSCKQAKVICGPMISTRSKPELTNLSEKNPGVLSAAGVTTAIATDYPVIPIHYLALSAGIAVSNGMDRTKALEAITIIPAKICGIDDKVGSISKGKDADLIVFDNDPLAVGVKPKMVIINGCIMK